MARIKGSDGQKTTHRALSAAIDLFAAKGYAAVSMREIAQEVGVNVGALYNHFPSKQDILVRVMSEHMDDLLLAWASEAPAPKPTDRLEQFVRFHIRFNIERPQRVFISYMELRALEEEGFKRIESLRKSYEDDLRAILISGRDQGFFDIEHPHVAAMSILASLTGINVWFNEQGPMSKLEIEEAYVKMVLRSVVGPNKEFKNV